MANETVSVTILNDDAPLPGVLRPEVTGLKEAIQAAHVAVAFGDRERTYVVLLHGEPLSFGSQGGRETMSTLFPGASVVFVMTSAEGIAAISCERADGLTLQGAAAAEATLKRCWGWDESPAIAVTINDAYPPLFLDPVWSGSAWSVEVPGG